MSRVRTTIETARPGDIEQWAKEAAAQINGLILRPKWTAKAVSASPYTVVPADVVLLLDTDVAITVQLPALAANQGRVLWVKDQQGAGAAVNNFTIDGSGSQLIDGALTYVGNVTRAAIMLFAGPTEWSIL